jgi:hypothetical protein
MAKKFLNMQPRLNYLMLIYRPNVHRHKNSPFFYWMTNASVQAKASAFFEEKTHIVKFLQSFLTWVLGTLV